jgi:hypothetical protein
MSARYSFTKSEPVPLGAQADREFDIFTNEVTLQAQVRF